MKRDLAGEKFDVVVLCHSLQPAMANEDVASLARRWWPQTKILLMRSDRPGIKHEQALNNAMPLADPVGMMRETLDLLRSLSNHHLEELLPPSALAEG
jgi:hypothetical protein